MLAAVILVLVGLGFVIAEVFFPSLGAFGIVAGTCILVADTIAFRAGPVTGWVFVGVELVLVPLAIWSAFRALPHTRFGRRMVLSGPANAPKPGAPALAHLVGRTGEALTDLRPAGTVRVGDERVSVVGLGGLIERGTEVVVVSVEGTEVRVRSVAPDGRSPF